MPDTSGGRSGVSDTATGGFPNTSGGLSDPDRNPGLSAVPREEQSGSPSIGAGRSPAESENPLNDNRPGSPGHGRS
jgi:hypothetical protein